MTYTNGTYKKFIQDKQDFGAESGFKPISLPSFLFDFQSETVEKAIRKGRSAIFFDCGMGKTPMQLVWADNVVRHTNKPVLILTPLAVSQQTLDEAQKFGMEAYRAIPDKIKPAIQVTNYERLHYFDTNDYAGIVCDESSILKNFDGIRKDQITEFMRFIPYRLLCTATAAPNDWPEIGTSSEALGYMGYMDMINRFFTNKNKTNANMRGKFGRDKFIMREYAKEYFWQWVASWARAARKPSDLGYDDNGFILPNLIENDIEVQPHKPPDGMLFDIGVTNFFEERELIRRTIQERCEIAAEQISKHNLSIAWCNLNDEAKLLKNLIPHSVEISGSDSDEKKEGAANWFINGEEENRVLISKPKIFGFGLNFQHSHHSTYFISHSYEQYYQATRRQWRFGQENEVIVDRIFAKGGKRVLKNLDRKSKAANKMFTELVKYMNDALHIENKYEPIERTVLPQWISK